MADLKNLIRKRGSVKARLTNFKNYVDGIIDVNGESNHFGQLCLIELQSRMQAAENLLLEFDEIQRDIENVVSDEEFGKQIEERNQFEDLFYRVISICKKILVDNNVKDENNGSELAVNSNSINAGVAAPVSYHVRPHLPSIPIPKFNGKTENWLEFRDTFLSLVHNNDSIGNMEKFHFLKGALEGEARQVVHLVDLSADNYRVIWDILCDRYNNTSLLVNDHLKSLLGITQLTKESAVDLRNLVDTLTKNLYALQKIGLSIDTWDPIVIYIVMEKLDATTRRVWEEQRPRKQLPTLTQFREFLKARVEMLVTLETEKNKSNKLETRPKLQKAFVGTVVFCTYCKDKHSINNCSEFLKLDTHSRFQEVKRLGLCLNCLKKGTHISKNCDISGCRKCGAKHHTLLHYSKQNLNNKEEVNVANNAEGTKNENNEITQVKTFYSEKTSAEVLLSTVLLEVIDCHGNAHCCRALLDSGSQSNLISMEMYEKLGLQKQNVEITITGINQIASQIKYKCLVKIQSLRSGYEKSISCLIVPQISEHIPNNDLDTSYLKIPSHLKLADPGFGKSGKVDILLGAEIFYSLLCIGQVALGRGLPTLQKTRLGWLVTGKIGSFGNQRSTICNYSMNLDIQEQLAKFWAVEESPALETCIMSREDKACEKIFIDTVKRDKDGRFVVQIPFQKSLDNLGNSRQYALERFLALEKRLERNSKLKTMYIDFMREYIAMEHMSLDKSSPNSISYYLPHHGVLNENSLTTKLRVVFNGSFKTDNGVSLNDLQYTGPILQEDLVSIVLRFRQHNVVLCADIAKMYRMILVNPDHRALQKIFWRENSNEKLNEYTLNTVTYGTKSAPYLAIRCLKQLGLENSEKFPVASQVILKDFYVDDMLTGSSNREDAITLGKQVMSILRSGCMDLRKWVSNDSDVIKELTGIDSNLDNVHFGEKDQNKTLGLYWAFKSDHLMYSIHFPCIGGKITKRSILSSISRIFDPLGLLGPVIIIAKVLLQKLWNEKLAWDETVPLEIDSKYRKLQEQFSYLHNLMIPRQVICKDSIIIEIHGYSDASMEAYGACVYMRSISSTHGIQVSLVYSKVKVAPLKSLTIPRLELCGALLLTKLVEKVKQSMTLTFHRTFFWTDSTVVLGWINTSPNLLNTFVSNRIAQIQDLSKESEWYYVKSEDNPADILSRGLTPEKIINCERWWKGPQWLSLDESNWPIRNFERVDLPDIKSNLKVYVTVEAEQKFDFERFSSFDKMKRVVAYIFRFYNKLKRNEVYEGHLRSVELQNALKCLIKLAQFESFGEEISDIRRGNNLKNKSLLVLAPFIDGNGLLRVGGRLVLSKFNYDKKHPILLSSKHKLTYLLFASEHKRLLHAGPQLLLSAIRENYWVIGGRNLARKTTFSCIRCFRVNPKDANQIMGVLPEDRVRPMPPFYNTGVDYAGPFLIKSKQGRGAKLTKCYVCLFVCFSTKCIHLELVSELTADAFVATFRRFVSRRGKPARMYSDNGTTFTGANSALKELGKFLKNQAISLSECFENEGVSWRFIPANSPNFGGLWEAGVKSCKIHLKKIMGNASLTFENFITLLAQIEAVLNSRPLVPLSPSPNDMDVLTPSHFLIGRRLTSLPDPDVRDIQINRLSRFQHIQMLYQHFWNRWSMEYISELQTRGKWKTNMDNLKVGQLVLVKDNNLPPLNWRLGRIATVFPGIDNRVRVASIKTQHGEIKRSITKLCPLPIENSTL